ncbi:PhoH family protein [Calothrix sp. FACHB-1219]|uniref:PhoH family protein n=1 Tax=unclassified Calothrix TaxID=2619626 RepID=UPI001683ABBA|nr:PhoH family protein [Calothrix sp. FACHB-168]MBD2201754.1 PhoH family protein [Calothrix sp. FACHB-168]MBD2217440.1 PhoH family protein [Calothrix sp. FACHB-1219]
MLIRPQNANQERYVHSIKNNLITIGIGPAGTGRSLLALYEGCRLINNSNSDIEKIIYLRANVGMEEEKSLGALPGMLSDKVAPLAYPVLDSLIQFMGEGQAKYLVETGKIEVLPIAMVRGRSFANRFIICDECQSCSPHMIKTILTRISYGSKMVLCGDHSQRDTSRYSDGLLDAINRLGGLDDIGIVRFNRNDVVRHPIIQHILSRYES